MRNDLIDANEDPECDISMNSSTYTRMLKEINDITKSLQSREQTLADCRHDLNVLIEAIEDEKQVTTSPFYGCRLGTKFIAANATIVKYPLFESGVVKIQKGKETDLNEGEKHAVRCLLKNHSSSTNTSEGSQPTSKTEEIAKRRKNNGDDNTYINCDFISGSVATVERLWSSANYVLASHPRRMTPQVLEAILFLRENERFWDAKLVAEAIGAARSERTNSRLKTHQEHYNSMEI